MDEPSVWTQLFAQVAGFVSSLLERSNALPRQERSGPSLNAPENAAPTTLTLKKTIDAPQNLLSIKRNPILETVDAHFGAMDFDGTLIGVTMERSAVAIPVGTYPGYKRDSARFGMRVVGIDVPSRSDIECHPANFPPQLNGCIAIGEIKDGDALDNSRTAFDRMMGAVPEEFTVKVS
jgi:hypothetical protein